MPSRPDRAAERRAERRTPAAGEVRLRSAELAGRVTYGKLMDRSAHGFRATHDFQGLASGQTVLFEHDGAGGRARVVWTRIADGRVESGFCYVPG